MSKHTPPPSTHIYKYKGSMYRFNWDTTGLAIIPIEVEYLWVDADRRIHKIIKRASKTNKLSRFVQNTLHHLSLSDK